MGICEDILSALLCCAGPSAESTEPGQAVALGTVVQAALLSAIPFGLASTCMVVRLVHLLLCCQGWDVVRDPSICITNVHLQCPIQVTQVCVL